MCKTPADNANNYSLPTAAAGTAGRVSTGLDVITFKSKSVKFTFLLFFDSIRNFRRRSFGKSELTHETHVERLEELKIW